MNRNIKEEMNIEYVFLLRNERFEGMKEKLKYWTT